MAYGSRSAVSRYHVYDRWVLVFTWLISRVFFFFFFLELEADAEVGKGEGAE